MTESNKDVIPEAAVRRTRQSQPYFVHALSFLGPKATGNPVVINKETQPYEQLDPGSTPGMTTNNKAVEVPDKNPRGRHLFYNGG